MRRKTMIIPYFTFLPSVFNKIEDSCYVFRHSKCVRVGVCNFQGSVMNRY